jgi:hypothetical protein
MNDHSTLAGLARALQSLPMLSPDWQIDELLARLDAIEAPQRRVPTAVEPRLSAPPMRARHDRRVWRLRNRLAVSHKGQRQAAAAIAR